jgi:hypothetical protein
MVWVPAGSVGSAQRADNLYLYQGIAIAAPAATAELSGTVTSADESQVADGGLTIILTLSNDTWVSAGATFDAQRQNILDGLNSSGNESTGWNNVVRDAMAVTTVVRTSDTVVTVTLTAAATYDITANETITATIPATALTGGVAIVADPTFTISYIPAVSRAGAGMGAKRYTRSRYPRRVVIDGKVYWVNSPQEERDLLELLLASAKEEVAEAAPAQRPRKRVVVKRLETRLEKVEEQEEAWLRYLRDRDEEIIAILAH